MTNIKNLTLEQKQLLLKILEAQVGIKAEPEKLDACLIESRKCNEIAKMKRAGQSVIYTQYQ